MWLISLYLFINKYPQKSFIRYREASCALLAQGNNFKNDTRLKLKSSYSTSFPSTYDPKRIEKGKCSWWRSKGYFQYEDKGPRPFSMLLPPPNITGVLHLGHALVCTVQDVLIRWKKMQGNSVLWIPGIDHAGIATQVVVEKSLWHEKKLSRHVVGRENFIQRVHEWKVDKEAVIDKQLEQLGVSVDWSRKFFTLDSKRSAAVTEAFIRLYESGQIYRSNSLVNWSIAIQSAISDIEVDMKEVNGPTNLNIPGYQNPVEFGVLVKFACKVHGSDEEILVATTRLETMPGDVAIAVNPKDNRFAHLHGKMVIHPIRNVLLPIICDEFVDPDFGTGAVKITPAHNRNDYTVGHNHNLQIIQAIDEEGKIMESCPQFSGLKRFDARARIMEELDLKGLLRGKENHSMQIPLCSRSGDVLELLLKPQWFLSCDEMAEYAASLVKEENLKIYPASFKNIWLNWLENSRDWCLSRQLWWGHQIPMYKCQKKNSKDSSVWLAARSMEEAKQKASQKFGISVNCIECYQDEDVLDTWFSSALLPFSSHGWPKTSEDFDSKYPLSVMVTGNDILFFWVARMVMLGHELTGKLPFEKVVLTGIICDAEGRKMSKSLGNVVHPEDIIHGVSLERLHEQAQESFRSGYLSSSEMKKSIKGQTLLFPKGIPECGVDALRFTLCSHNVTSHFINFDVSECHTNRLFCNKIWQASKYVLLCHEKVLENIPFLFSYESLSVNQLGLMEQWILSRLHDTLHDISKGLNNADLHICTAAIKKFIYYEFCDIYLETTKSLFRDTEVSHENFDAQRCAMDAVLKTLRLCLGTSIQAFAPFMPFLAEELYQQFYTLSYTPYKAPESIFLTDYPQLEKWKLWDNKELEGKVMLMMDIVWAIRRLLSENGIKKKDSSSCYLQFSSSQDLENMKSLAKYIQGLSNCTSVSFGNDEISDSQRRDSTALGPCTVHLNLTDAVVQTNSPLPQNKVEKEKKLMKQLQKLVMSTESSSYKTKAPAQVQKAHAEKIIRLQDKIKKLQAS